MSRFGRWSKKWEDSDEIKNKSAVPTVFNASIQQAFIKKFQAEYGEQAEPDGLAALGYDSVMLVAHGLKKAGEAKPGQMAEKLQSMPACQGAIGQYRFRVGGQIVNRAFYFKQLSQEQFAYQEVVPGQGMVLVPEKCGYIDRDKDGIANDVDVCPDNSSEEISKGVVQQGDFIGCPLDSDQDGYQDYRDACPNTQKPEFEKGIDSRGCPKDTDNDGVPDYKDLCSDNVLASTLVDEQGCAPDADHDHVFDDKDTCPNNKPEELTQGVYLQGDKAGCPIDRDEDGVPDYQDRCFLNNSKEIKKGVDSDGCPADTDHDNIPDYEDVCVDNSQPEIKSGVYQQGDQIGCPVDSDQDSVPDYRDMCADNRAEELANGT